MYWVLRYSTDNVIQMIAFHNKMNLGLVSEIQGVDFFLVYSYAYSSFQIKLMLTNHRSVHGKKLWKEVHLFSRLNGIEAIFNKKFQLFIENAL